MTRGVHGSAFTQPRALASRSWHPSHLANPETIMSAADFCNTDINPLHDTDTVAEATRRMLADRVSDLPVVAADGTYVGLFKLDRLFASLLPKAALLGYGVPDLSFLHETHDHLRSKMREIDTQPVRDFAVTLERTVFPDTPALEVILQLYRGANNVPVVDHDGHLIGMVSPRDVLSALHNPDAK